MANSSAHFESDPSMIGGQNTAPGTPYGGYGTLYGAAINNNIGFNTSAHHHHAHHSHHQQQQQQQQQQHQHQHHQGTTATTPYSVPGPATPPILPPMHSNPYAPQDNGSNFSFSYQNHDPSAAAAAAAAAASGPATPSGSSVGEATGGGGGIGGGPATAVGTPTGAHSGNPMDNAAQMDASRRSMEDLDARRTVQLPHPQQQSPHPQTPHQQLQKQQQQQQHLQRQASYTSVISHPNGGTHQQQQQQQQQQPPPQQQLHHTQNSMSQMIHNHPNNLYGTDSRPDARLTQQQQQQSQQQQQQQRYVDPSMQRVLGRSNSRSGDMGWSTQPNMMMPSTPTTPTTPSAIGPGAPNNGAGGGGGGGPIRHSVGAQQSRAIHGKRSRDFGVMDPSAGMAGLGGMGGVGGMSAAMGGMTSLPGMSPIGGGGGSGGGERFGWGGMVGAGAPHPYSAPPDHHHSHAQQQLHQQHNLQHAHSQQQMHFQRMGPHSGGGGRMMGGPMGGGPLPGMPGMPGMNGMGAMGGLGGMGGLGMAIHNGMGPISKKRMKKMVVPVVKDKNCPKRPRNSYIFFTLMKRDDIKKKHPEFKPTEITKMLGEEWQKLSETEKESYGSMAEDDKKRYQSEMEAYDSSNTGNSPLAVGGGNGIGGGGHE
ncbi:hypothetical protein BGZ50_006978 [Haplosporangium sp. Z 11]|nr:hypothetical protein BGZ50_006978 [Haplosporangium sp. Z 11]